MKKKELEQSLKNPLEFWKLLPHYGNKFDLIIEKIRNHPYFSNLFKNLSNSEVIEISKEISYEINRIKEWLLNSELRTLSFYYLGIMGIATSSDLGRKIEKHPKSISIYLKEFIDKNWIELIPDEDGRKKNYCLTELGKSYYNIAENDGWFERYTEEPIVTDETILKLDYGMGMRLDESEKGLEKAEYFPEIEILIKKIRKISERLNKDLNLNIIIPGLRRIHARNDLLSINTTNEEQLAVIFAAITYLDKNMFDYRGNTYYPGVTNIKFINPDYYFNKDNPFPWGDENFLSFEETKTYISKILAQFRKKHNLNKNYT